MDASGRTFGVLYVGVKQSEFFRSFRVLVTASIVIAVVLAVVFGAMLALMTGRILGRIAVLSKAADAISLGENLETPITSDTKDEIGELSTSIDRLRESMQVAMKRMEG